MTASRISSRPRYFFCHLQKTGGTSLLFRLRRHFTGSRVYPVYADGDRVARVLSVPLLLRRWQERGHEIELIAGHFPLCARLLLGGEFATFTVLREPVQRTLSFLRHHRRMVAEDRHKDLEAIYDDRQRFDALIHNHQVKMLSLTIEEMKRGALTPITFTDDHLARARQALSSMDVVGTQDQFEDFCTDLRDRFAFQLGNAVVVNRTRPVQVTASFRNRIARDNAMDAELYEFARAIVAARRSGVAGRALTATRSD